jgi:putative transposase
LPGAADSLSSTGVTTVHQAAAKVAAREAHDLMQLQQGRDPDRRGHRLAAHVPVLDARYSYRSEDVVATLDRVCGKIGSPRMIRVDQGSEFVSRDMDLRACQRGVTLDFPRPGKPTDNAHIDAFNGRLRTECLNPHWFLTLADATAKLEAWRRYYNQERPYGAIGNKVPIALTKSGGATSPSP